MIAPPRISGRALRHLASFARTKVGALALKQVFLADLKVSELAKLPESLLGDMPIDNRPLQGRAPRAGHDAGHGAPTDKAWAGTSASFTAAYRAGKTTPRDVVERALAAARVLADRKPSVGPLMAYLDDDARAEAEHSTARYQAGAPRGPLDGVLFAVKEEAAIRGLPRQGGSSVEDATPCARDATCVARLRALGAIVIGQTPMTEYGMTPMGFNPKRVMPRNPHAVGHVAGGSSTGSGVAVATGLVPFAIGCDGGGSIRIPAALNGVFGIKPTWGRVSRAGDLAGGTVAHVGPLASSTLDLARMLEAIGTPDAEDGQTDGAPPIAPGSLERALGRGVRGMRIAVDAHEWSEASDAVAKAGKEALRALEKEGAILVDVKLELARFAAPIGYLTIGMEDRAMKRTLWRERPTEFNYDLQIMYAVLGELGVVEYCEAQRMRCGLRAEMAKLFREVDLFALPTTAQTATHVSDAEMEHGFLDARALDALCRFNFLGNLTGLPAVSAPVGLDAKGLPIGLQLVGDAWDEATVLAASAHLERIEAAKVARPGVSVSVLVA